MKIILSLPFFVSQLKKPDAILRTFCSNCFKLLRDFIGCQALSALFLEFHREQLMLNTFPDAMLFSQVFIRYLFLLAGFQSNIEEIKGKIPSKFYRFLLPLQGKTPVFINAYAARLRT